jgi:hypothetical protein
MPSCLAALFSEPASRFVNNYLTPPTQNRSHYHQRYRQITSVDQHIQPRPLLKKGTDPEALATYVLAVMEGGVMISRSCGSVDPFDRAVKQLRQHFALLLASEKPTPPSTKKTKVKTLATRNAPRQQSSRIIPDR